jgi:hypothetical protein
MAEDPIPTSIAEIENVREPRSWTRLDNDLSPILRRADVTVAHLSYTPAKLARNH